MIINGISDLHGSLKKDIPKCDVLCICGDIVNLSVQRNMQMSEYWFYNKFFDWIKNIDCEKVLIVPGNHDFYLESKYKENYKQLKDNFRIQTDNKAILLIDDSYLYNNIKFYGSPWTTIVEFQRNLWAFSEPLDSNNKLNNIPEDVDILLTHDSPYHNSLLLNKSKNIKYHLYGHWHDGEDDINNNRYNCSLLTDNYNFKKKFILPKINIMENNNVSTNKVDYSEENLKNILEKVNSMKESLENGYDIINEEKLNMMSILIMLLEDRIAELECDVSYTYNPDVELNSYDSNTNATITTDDVILDEETTDLEDTNTDELECK